MYECHMRLTIPVATMLGRQQLKPFFLCQPSVPQSVKAGPIFIHLLGQNILVFCVWLSFGVG